METTKLQTATYHPDSPACHLDDLDSEFQQLRKSSGEKALTVVASVTPAIAKNAVQYLQSKPARFVDSFFEDPAFTIWSNFLFRSVKRETIEEVEKHCRNLPDVTKRIEQRLWLMPKAGNSNSQISIYQLDIDPYIMAATPPSYDFMPMLSFKNGITGHGHSLTLQRELVSLALTNIQSCWPELGVQIEKVVKIIGYLPDATFRSCSAARYSGVVYLGNMDESLLDLEESIVHEAGHQVLYRIGELSPLVQNETPQDANYELPWSGSKRDLFGFLHAFYIYTLLTKFLVRRASLSQRDRLECFRRAATILIGSKVAVPMLLSDMHLTQLGRSIIEEISSDMSKLEANLTEVCRKEIEGYANA